MLAAELDTGCASTLAAVILPKVADLSRISTLDLFTAKFGFFVDMVGMAEVELTRPFFGSEPKLADSRIPAWSSTVESLLRSSLNRSNLAGFSVFFLESKVAGLPLVWLLFSGDSYRYSWMSTILLRSLRTFSVLLSVLTLRPPVCRFDVLASSFSKASS